MVATAVWGNDIMQRVLIIYNPRSSRYADVREKVLTPARKLSGYMIGKYEVAPTNPDDNMKKLAKLIQDGDLVISAGGDATGVIATNAVMKSGKKAELAALPFGNFNDLARTLQLESLDDVLKAKKELKQIFTPMNAKIVGVQMGEFFPTKMIIEEKLN